MAKTGKNTHLEHLEDEIINEGAAGGKKVIEILKYMGDFLSGAPSPQAKVTTKYDGAPAIVCGIDPSDGKFFVGTKSVFAQTPKLCKTQQDVQEQYDGALASKLSDALKYLPQVVKSGVLQGDLMFTNDKRRERIIDKHYITFRPNTITYAVNPNTPMGRQIEQAKLGIVFHTKYTGTTLANMQSSFILNDNDFTSTSQVWAEKAEFTNISGAASMSQYEKAQYDAAVSRAEGSLRQASRTLDAIQSGKKTLKIDTEFKKFFNNYVKQGKSIPSVDTAYKQFFHHLGGEYAKAIEKNKTLDAQANKAGNFIEVVDWIMANEKGLKMIIAAYMNLQVCKNILVDKMKRVQRLNLFVDMGNGDYRVTADEGYVAIVNNKATKLVDRLEFSKLNFTVPKQWG